LLFLVSNARERLDCENDSADPLSRFFLIFFSLCHFLLNSDTAKSPSLQLSETKHTAQKTIQKKKDDKEREPKNKTNSLSLFRAAKKNK